MHGHIEGEREREREREMFVIDTDAMYLHNTFQEGCHDRNTGLSVLFCLAVFSATGSPTLIDYPS